MNAWLHHDRLGYNYRMDEMSAALGVSQLRRIVSFLAKREKVANMYTARLKKYSWVRAPIVKPYVKMSWFIYVVTLAEGLNRDLVMKEMEKEGVPTRGYFSPIHLQPYVRERVGNRKGELPITEDICNRTLALPFHNNLSEEEVSVVVETLRKVVERME